MNYLQASKREIKILAPAISALNRNIFDRPELNFEEHYAAGAVSGALAEQGFKIRRGNKKLKTAFEAVWRGGKASPTVAILAEYDALPNLGHACGHNMIAAAAFGAAVAVKRILGKKCGTLKVIGTPAEEGGGRKTFDDKGRLVQRRGRRDHGSSVQSEQGRGAHAGGAGNGI